LSVVNPTTVVLPGAVWQAELEAELVRLGVDPVRASASATRVLHRVVAHHGWPRTVIRVAEQDPLFGDPSKLEESALPSTPSPERT
jgi:hypothetical protein